MIGVITGVARTALSQVARQFGREAMERIMAGEAIESVLTRDQLRELAKKTGRVAFNELMKQGKDSVIEDYSKKNADWNARMNDFTRNLDDEFRKYTTLYKEERDIANKNKIEDRRGLWNAYDSPSGFYRTGNTLYISGTGGKDGSLNRDIMDDLLLFPTRNVKHSEKYNDVIKYLRENSDVKRLVGHSLASAVVNKINQDMPDKYTTTTYASPTIRRKRKGKQDPRHKDYRNKADIVSFLDGYAETSNSNELNPLMAHSYINFKHNGMWHINPTTSISNGINPNSPIQQ
jgi:hypothetical protein